MAAFPEGDSPAANAAAARCSFQLTYARADVPRQFSAGALSGPWIPDAYGGDLDSPGEWEEPEDSTVDLTEAEWVDRFARYALNEAIHEALEWFRVDGAPWLDPHGEQEDVIYELTNELCARLAELRATSMNERRAA